MKDILVTFDLKEADGNDYRRAYEALAEMGLTGSAQNILFPSTTVAGRWMSDAAVDQIRDGIIAALRHEGLRVEAMLVAEYSVVAWSRLAEPNNGGPGT